MSNPSKIKPKAKAPALKPTASRVPRKVVSKVQRPNGKIGLSYHVPECVHHYLEASINPFETAEGACLPADLFPLPSYKRVIFARGSFQTGTTGFGYVSMSPIADNTTAAVNFTQSTSVGGASTVISVYTGIGSVPFVNGPYSNAQFAAAGAINARSVAYGIRVRCTSSMMNRGGSYVTYEQIAHADVTPLYSYNTLKSTQGSQTHGIPMQVDPDQWDVSVCSSGPVLPSELAYNTNPLGANNGNQILICMINSAVPAMTFDFECYHHVEYNGNITTKTPSHASPAGFSKAVEAMKDYTTTIGPVSTKAGPNILERFVEGIRSEMPRIIEIGSGIGQMLLGNEFGGVAQIADGSLNILGDILTPSKHRMLTDTQKSVLAPDLPMIGWH